ncbi:hypothetical protein H2199_007343 [Coniosporium tulheliwenetii]|uniref:Uncharacterized protein n=1 Tax=Coniosporium tulheliwenetii TaxID=3383036 RepID=A0ACC2YS48_9PEZI|nr:hypothetical protein H2199_007343 [Cladosporium sp. JES 115]
MAALVGKYAAKKLLGKQMEKYKSKEPVGRTDPYFVYVEDPKRKGKMKKMKKQVPDYIPEHDAMILAKMRSRSYALDCSLFSLFGTRFGWSSVIGLVPAAGDAIDFALAVALVYRCSRVECGLGGWTITMMILNVIADFLVGLIPFVGDLVDAAFKANTRNVLLLEKRLDEAYNPHHKRNKDADKKDKPLPATVLESFSDDEDERLPQYRNDGLSEPRRPEPARQPVDTKGGAASAGRYQADLESGRGGTGRSGRR